MLSLKNVKVPIDNKKDLKDIIAAYLHVNSNKIKSYKIHKESIDARVKHEFCYIYEFWVEIENEEKYLSKNITKVVEEKYIFPYIHQADVIINTALAYEVGVLKVYVEPLLLSVGVDSIYYEEARRLIGFLNQFFPIPGEYVTDDSILREFIGGKYND